MPGTGRAVEMPLGHGRLALLERYRIGRQLAADGYDQAIVLPNSLKSALIPWHAGIPRRTGFRGEMRYGLLNDMRRLDDRTLPMTVQRFAALGLDDGAPLPDPLPRPELAVTAEETGQALQALGLQRGSRPLLALCPGAEYGPAKRWPEAYFAEVAKHRLADGWDVWLFGSDADSAVTAAINELAGGRCEDLAGRTQLDQAICLLSLADAVVSNDSGLMHVAAALDRPLVALYGSSDPGFTPPLSERARVLHLGLACSPCFERECPLGHLDCLRQIEPRAVEGALVAVTGAA